MSNRIKLDVFTDKLLNFAGPIIFWAGFALFVGAAYKTIQWLYA